MQLYRSTLKLSSASVTPWQADTVFGHLCWNLARREGEDVLQTFLELYQEGLPPILVSDGCPGDYLPRPLLPRGEVETTLPKAERVERQRQVKRSTHAEWLTLDEFNRVRLGESVVPSLTETDLSRSMRSHLAPKNQIDRLTNTAGGEGGALYVLEELVWPMVSFYWRVEDGYLNMLKSFLADLAAVGYGKRKSVGYGQVASYSLEEFDGFADVPTANGFVTLSRFVPAPTDPTNGYWNTVVKYGKLGEEFANEGNPFKRPVVQLACGSCFLNSPVHDWYGQLLGGLSQREDVKQYAFAFPLPMVLPEGGNL